MHKKVYLVILLVSLMFIQGCKTTLVVHNATADQIKPILKDYAGVHGYRISYQNDQTGTYGLDLGNVYVPYSSQTTKSTSVIAQPANEQTGQPMTAYEQTTWNTVTNGGHYEQATASVIIYAQGGDTIVVLEGNNAAGSSLNDFYDYLVQHGYTVERK